MRGRSILFLLSVATPIFCAAQNRLPSMPGYERWLKFGASISGSISRPNIRAQWIDGGNSFVFEKDGKRQRFDLAKKSFSEFNGEIPSTDSVSENRNSRRPGPSRGRQFTESISGDGKRKAIYRDRNVYITDAQGKNEIQITHDGNQLSRVKNGSASWVYGEELGQREAMGWSPSGELLWYYRFDESKISDYYLTLDEVQTQNRLYPEAYVKAGAPNPEVDIFIYDSAKKKTTKVRVRNGTFDENVGHYIYGVEWSPDGSELWFHRTNRKQDIMEWCGANPETGAVRVIVREEWPASWTENSPPRRYFDVDPNVDKSPKYKNKVLWTSERNGYSNFYLLDLKSTKLTPITQHKFEVQSVVRVDLAQDRLWYMARDGVDPYRLQLHCVGLDGKGERRLTDPSFHHTVQVAPDGKSFVDTYEAIDTPPTVQVCDERGKPIARLAETDMSKFKELGLKRVERLKFPAMDGKTVLYGELNFPSQFDPTKKYPLIVNVYAGPESGGGTDRFQLPDRLTEFGFLVASFDGRGTNGRGKAFKDEVYEKLGIVEIDDQAAGVKYLSSRPYVDAARVGIQGTSYGGYATTMCLLRYPDLFAVGCASSSVTDWRNYDSIYTERYMNTPQNNAKGYDAGSAMTYANNLKGRLMLFYGTADDNVHPSNTLQLVRALQRVGKGYDMQVGPDQGHSGMNPLRMIEYFIDHLVLNK